MRLDRFLSAGLGLGSRNDVKKMIRAGRVSVIGIEGAKLRPETGIDEENAKVYVDGELMRYRKYIYLMLNKPAGVVSATSDRHYKTVTDLLPDEYRHFEPFPVGRLDIDTEGLCLLTNDGALAHRLLSPKKHVPKLYYAEINMPVTDDDIAAFKNGITLDDGYSCMTAELNRGEGARCVYVRIFEGKFHQVKRMFEAVGKSVVYLKRIQIKNLRLDDDLDLGEIRELTDAEIIEIRDL